MEIKQVKIKNATGMHARPASLLVSQMTKFSSQVELVVGDKVINAKSIMSLLAGGLVAGTDLEIRCQGTDEVAACEAAASFIEGLED